MTVEVGCERLLAHPSGRGKYRLRNWPSSLSDPHQCCCIGSTDPNFRRGCKPQLWKVLRGFVLLNCSHFEDGQRERCWSDALWRSLFCISKRSLCSFLLEQLLWWGNLSTGAGTWFIGLPRTWCVGCRVGYCGSSNWPFPFADHSYCYANHCWIKRAES